MMLHWCLLSLAITEGLCYGIPTGKPPAYVGHPAGRREEKRFASFDSITSGFAPTFDPCDDLFKGSIVTKRRIISSSGSSLWWDPCDKKTPFGLGAGIVTRQEKRFANFDSIAPGFAPTFNSCDDLFKGSIVTKRRIISSSGSSLWWDPCDKKTPFGLGAGIVTRQVKRVLPIDPCLQGKLGGVVMTKRFLADFSNGKSLWWNPCVGDNMFSLENTQSEEKRFANFDSIASGFAPTFDPCDDLFKGSIVTKRRLISSSGSSLWWDPCDKKTPFGLGAGIVRRQEKRDSPCTINNPVMSRRKVADIDGWNLFANPCKPSGGWSISDNSGNWWSADEPVMS